MNSSVNLHFRSVLLGFFLISIPFLLVVGCNHQPSEKAPDGQSKTATPMIFEGFQFEVPEKWARIQPDRNKTVAMLLLSGTESSDDEGMIKVDVGKPTLQNPEEVARSLAGNDGRVLSERVKLDGETGIQVEIPSQDMSRPSHALVVFRDKRLFLLMAGGIKKDEVNNAFKQVIKTWRWSSK